MTSCSYNQQGGPFANVVDGFVYPPFIGYAMRAPTTGDVYNPGTRWQDNSVNPAIIYETTGGGVWTTEGANHATTTTYGTVILTDNNEPVATKFYADNLAIMGSPAATETTPGIAEIATQVETDAGVLDDKIVTPLKLANFIGGGGFPGVFTDLTATGTVSFTGATGGITMTSTTASSFGTTGAGIDLTLSSASGSVPISAGEAVANAIGLQAAAGGIDIDGALQVNIASSQNAVDAIRIISSAGGIDVDAVGSAGEDINLTATGSSIRLTATESATDSINIESTLGGINILASGASAGEDINVTATGSSVNVSSTENAALAIYLHADGGASETIRLRADQGTGDNSVDILSDVGGLTLTGGKAAATAIKLVTSDAAGGITMSVGTGGILPTTSGKFTVISTDNAAQAIELHANGGVTETIRIRADQGTSATSLDLLSDVGGITLNAGLGTGNAIVLNASGVGGGFNVDAGAGGFILDTPLGAISLDSGLASNFTVTGAADLSLISTAGSIVVTGGEAAVDAIQLNATTALGGIDVNAGTGGMTVDSGGLLSLDAAGIVNLTTTGAFDITVNSTAGSIVVTGAEAAVDAIQLNATTVGGGIDINAGSGGITLDTTAALSLDSATASNFTVTGAADLTLQSTAGAVNVISGEANLDSINVTSAGGMNVVAVGAAAKDIIITNTNGSMTLTAGESVTDAMNITASGAASRVNITAGTGSIKFASGWIVPITTKAFGDTPYTVLGTDYLINCDTSAGVLQVTLPAASAVAGRTFVIRDGIGNAGVNNITINGGGTNLVGGGAAAATKVLSAAYSGATVYSNGTVWLYAYVA